MFPLAGRITEAMQLRYLHIRRYDLPHTWRIDGRELDNAVIWLIDDGAIRLETEGFAPIDAADSDVLFLAPGTKLTCRARTASLSIVSLNFEAAFAGRWPVSLRFPVRYEGDRAELAAVLHGLLADEAAAPSAAKPFLLQAGLLRLLGLMAAGMAAKREAMPETGGIDARVREAIARMAGRPDAFPASAELAEAAGVSESHLRKLFLRETGMTPLQYALRLKVSLAMRRLAGSDDRIAEIAYSLGYEDPNYFARLFRKCSGMTPQEYRRKHRDWMLAEETEGT
ncbi:helix-turn-helix transcriptional regulator [Cohnella zeiphila]|uniref:Helix-turn-helix transcriptional regulator n=1 Tax=Cohnella zeiphila TaxID=2761120 RepID=A0A7X0VV04_9BACL|nr:AraC family transcriptional regulator [Cohnella zeiphila]MBB6730930.1 helix-turn-helix transcriptional regulator [Cohnella zeiphila]